MKNWKNSLGFACVVAGRKGLRAADGRRPENGPHLRHSLRGLLEVFDYLEEIDVRVFRLPSGLIPYATHPDRPSLHWKKQIKEAKKEIEEVAQRREELNLRLSFHPSQFILLNSPRQEVTRSSKEELLWQAKMLDMLGCGPEARVLIHAGGVYDDRAGARKRLLQNTRRMPKTILSRLAFENDDRLWAASEVLEVSEELELPMIFDLHHHACYNHGEDWKEMMTRAFKTWDAKPKIHLSSPRLVGDKLNMRAHADYIDPFLFRRLLDKTHSLPDYDIMLEAKKKDLALLELRKDEVLGKSLP